MFAVIVHLLLIVSITCCPVMCELGICACTEVENAIDSCCCSESAPSPCDSSSKPPQKNPTHQSEPFGTHCICGGAVVGDVVDVNVRFQHAFDIALDQTLVLDASMTASHDRLGSRAANERLVKSGRMIRCQLMSLTC